jgi:hypothetical protein
MLFTPIVAWMRANWRVFGSMVGINAVSSEWNDLLEHLKGPEAQERLLFLLDYAKYDKSFRYTICVAAALIFRDVARKIGFSVENQKRVFNAALSLSCLIVIYKAEAFLTKSMNASGHFLTTDMNGLVQLLLLLFAYVVLKREERGGPITHEEFFDNVGLGLYGDDCAAGVSKDFSTWFHAVSVAEVLAYVGVVAQSPFKSEELQPNYPWRMFSFLKRGYVKTDFGCLAPLEKASIYRSLCWHVRTTLTEEMHAQNVALNALREAWLHGEEFFNELRARIDKASQGKFVARLETFAELKDRFVGGDFVVYDA